MLAAFNINTSFERLLVVDIFGCVMIAVGLFFLLLEFMNIPSLRIKRNTFILTKSTLRTPDSFDVFINKMASKIEPLIKLNPLKRKKMLKQFETINLQKSPERFYATCIVKGALLLLVAPFGFILHPLLGILFIISAVIIFLLEYNSVDNILTKRRVAIEIELPRFIAIVEQTLKNDRDVVKMIKGYIGEDTTPLCNELRITLSDLKTGDYETAFSRFAARIDSGFVTEAARGLISAMRGDDTASYFEMLSIKLWDNEKMRIEKEAMKSPGKVKFLVVAMLSCMAIIYVCVFGTVIFDGLKDIFEVL